MLLVCLGELKKGGARHVVLIELVVGGWKIEQHIHGALQRSLLVLANRVLGQDQQEI